MAGKEEINLETEPAPDLVIEVDKSNQSLRKFPIYAAFGVREVWRYLVRQKKAEIYELQDKNRRSDLREPVLSPAYRHRSGAVRRAKHL